MKSANMQMIYVCYEVHSIILCGLGILAKPNYFFVPTLLNASIGWEYTQNTGHICVEGKQYTKQCFRDKYFYQYIIDMLGKQVWFQRHQGRDHVIVASQSAFGKFCGLSFKSYKCPTALPNLRNGNVISLQGEKQFHTKVDIRFTSANPQPSKLMILPW